MAQLTLNVDVQNRQLVQGFTSALLAPTLTTFQGDTLAIFLRFLGQNTTSTNGPYVDIDYSAAAVALGIGIVAAQPTSGTFTITDTASSQTTAAIAYNATPAQVQSAINAALTTNWSTATVSGSNGGPYIVNRVANNTIPLLSINVGSLSPAAVGVINTLQTGSSTTPAIQYLEIVQQPIAYQNTWTPAPAASLTIATTQAGTSTNGAVQLVTIGNAPYSGTFSLTFNGQTAAGVAYNASPSAVQSALQALSTIGAGNCAVGGVAGSFYTVAFTGTLATGAQPIFVGDASGLVSPKGLIGNVALNTAAVEQAIGELLSITQTLEIQVIPSGGYKQTILQAPVIIYNDLIQGAPVVIAPGVTYQTQTQADARYMFSGPGFYAVASGTANAITATLSPAPGSLYAGLHLALKITAANTGAATANINGLGTLTIQKNGTALSGGEMVVGQVAEYVYDGTNLQLLNPQNSSASAAPQTFIANLTGSTAVPAANSAITSSNALSLARVDIASAATVAIGGATSNYLRITGTATITAFDSVAAGIYRTLLFAGSLTLTNNATSLILPGTSNITTQANDVAVFFSEGSGNWRLTDYLAATGPGSVTNFTAGSLSPLFTASVVTPTTTPALTFGLSSAAQNSVLAGPATGGAGVPSYQVAPTISGTNLTALPTTTSLYPALPYAPAPSGSSILAGNGSGGLTNVTVGTGLTYSGGALGLTGGSATTGYKNFIIGGDFGINPWQRGTTFTGVSTNASLTYTADRWGVYAGATGASINVYQHDTTPLTGYAAYLQIGRPSSNTSTASINAAQIIESLNTIPLQGQSVVLSFYAQAGANFSGSNLGIKIVTGTNLDQGGASYISGWTGSATPLSTTQSITTTWTRYSFTATVGATAQELAVSFSYIPSGTAGSADFVNIAGVQLEIGSAVTNFERRPVGLELALCQRYYQTGNAYSWNYLSGSGAARGAIVWIATMRSAPSVAVSAISYGNCTGLSISTVSNNVFSTQVNVSGAGVYYADFTYTASAEL